MTIPIPRPDLRSLILQQNNNLCCFQKPLVDYERTGELQCVQLRPNLDEYWLKNMEDGSLPAPEDHIQNHINATARNINCDAFIESYKNKT